MSDDVFAHKGTRISAGMVMTKNGGQFLPTILTVREITKSRSIFPATNISSYIIWLLQLHDKIQMKSNYTWINYNHDNIAIRSHIMINNSVQKLNFWYQI